MLLMLTHLALTLVLSLTSLKTGGSGRTGPKGGTSSLAVTDTWKKTREYVWARLSNMSTNLKTFSLTWYAASPASSPLWSLRTTRKQCRKWDLMASDRKGVWPSWYTKATISLPMCLFLCNCIESWRERQKCVVSVMQICFLWSVNHMSRINWHRNSPWPAVGRPLWKAV